MGPNNASRCVAWAVSIFFFHVISFFLRQCLQVFYYNHGCRHLPMPCRHVATSPPTLANPKRGQQWQGAKTTKHGFVVLALDSRHVSSPREKIRAWTTCLASFGPLVCFFCVFWFLTNVFLFYLGSVYIFKAWGGWRWWKQALGTCFLFYFFHVFSILTNVFTFI